MEKKIVFSGIQPTGEIHLGNYFGSLKQWLDLQDKYFCLFSVVNLHALTEPISSSSLEENTLKTTDYLLSLGLDPKKVILFVQSDIPYHTELTWLLSVVTPVGDLLRMTQFKDKAKQFKETVNAGLLNYPILMASDILLYKAEYIPVGKDQLQHLELTREIARRFNRRFGQTFPLPKAVLEERGAKIMSLAEPRKKMSKSLGEEHYLGIFEEPEKIREKIAKAVTDSGKEIKYDQEKKPGIANLLRIYSLVEGKEIKEIEREFQGKGYAEFKKILAEKIIDYFSQSREKFLAIKDKKEEIREILKEGRRKAEEIAQKNIEEIRQKVGLKY